MPKFRPIPIAKKRPILADTDTSAHQYFKCYFHTQKFNLNRLSTPNIRIVSEIEKNKRIRTRNTL